ncbi:hypothetical protein [Weissella viridescens]|uniref:hypothetical protein n=1 Tax=Weissella viridescens TaxID=1629 RepID=UPI003AF2A10C
MDYENREPVPQAMMGELKLAGEVSQPIDLEKIINNHNFLIDTPLIKSWYENKADKDLAQKKANQTYVAR